VHVDESHGHGHGPEGTEVDPEEDAATDAMIWAHDNVVLTSVGVDIGSSTSHLLISRLHLERAVEALSSRFRLVSRTVLFESPILLTPFTADGRIDAGVLRSHVLAWYAEARITPDDVDTGAVILTGVALDRTNARLVAETFAEQAGRFVTASAGHHLEATLSAHGSGTVATSEVVPERFLHVDIGGGTTKLSVVAGGEVLDRAAVAVGGRLVTWDEEGRLSRVEPAGRALLDALGLDAAVGDHLAEDGRRAVAGLAGTTLAEVIQGRDSPLAKELMVTAPLRPGPPPDRLTLSGGVARYLAEGRGAGPSDDLGELLLDAFVDRVAATSLPRPEAAQHTIRATAIGASQFVVQASGNTLDVEDATGLPLSGLPVARPSVGPTETDDGVIATAIGEALARLDLGDGDGPLALSVPYAGRPAYAALRGWATAILRALPRSSHGAAPLVVVLGIDLASSLGRVLRELDPAVSGVMVLDGIDVHELDYVDVGAMIEPTHVVPVLVRTLAFRS
jgi:ethanolamine utilization protein EutA